MVLKIPFLAVLCLALLCRQEAGGFFRSSNVVTTRYGSMQGLIVKPANRALGQVSVFYGVPYAAPPIGHLRFMPPMSPLSWMGLKRFQDLPPVCPQKLPDVTNRREALRRMPEGRFNYLQRLLPLLRNQNEDCLHLNIYAPIPGTCADVLFSLPRGMCE
ncbi:neuroligin-4, Y-linked-like [Macrobrachium rosenbergii]|uniref:neuroligin-4, Y-linked-like n=1 Tax=Macrobrachium rosenbergii TaxID=79674 RepID=UPI0034D3AA6F